MQCLNKKDTTVSDVFQIEFYDIIITHKTGTKGTTFIFLQLFQ